MEHYYTQKPGTPHDIHTIDYAIKDLHLQFYTDAGVFSKTKVDFGSDCLLRSLPPLSGRVLDLGCGYGVIGLSLATLNPSISILMADINERAVELTGRNIEKNEIVNAQVSLSDGFQNVEGLFDTIVCNPPIRAGKDVIYPLFEQSHEYLLPGGGLYLVIQKKQGANSAINKLESIYGNCTAIYKEAGYWILYSKKS